MYVYDSNGTQVYGVPVTANQYRSDLVNAGMGNGYHGFSVSIPWGSLPFGQLKVVVYAVDGSGNHPSIYNGLFNNIYSYGNFSSLISSTPKSAGVLTAINQANNDYNKMSVAEKTANYDKLAELYITARAMAAGGDYSKLYPNSAKC